MIVTRPHELPTALRSLSEPSDVRPSDSGPTTMRAALLVRPDAFRVSDDSARDNVYMKPGVEIDRDRARSQHEAVARVLLDLGVPVLAFPGIEGQDDGVYPNNVFGFAPRRIVIGSMRHAVRRREAERDDIRSLFVDALGYEIVDLFRDDVLAELTGSLIIDHLRGIGFCGLSSRTNIAGCEAMHEAFGLRLTLRFELAPSEYHTNIVLSVLAGRLVVLHPPSFADPDVPRAITSIYGDATIHLNDEEKASFVGNCLAVTERDVLMSSTSLAALSNESRHVFDRLGFRVHGVAVDELEKGGGSLRCLIAEVF